MLRMLTAFVLGFGLLAANLNGPAAQGSWPVCRRARQRASVRAITPPPRQTSPS